MLVEILIRTILHFIVISSHHLFILWCRKGSNVKGYFAWAILDNFQWSEGYTVRFGINYVDFDGLQRYPKNSTHWFTNFLKKRKGSSNILANNVGDTDFLYQV